MKSFNDLIINAAKEGSSDLHITPNQPLVYRRNGFIVTEKAMRMSKSGAKDAMAAAGSMSSPGNGQEPLH